MSTKDIEVGPPSYDNHPEEEAAEAEEERLPLYGGFQYEHAGAHQDDLPTNAASPNEVRDFIVHVLVSRRQLPVDHARRIATRWTIGSGLEMRSYPASMYLELFGSEDGWILYREIKLMMHAEANRKFMHRYMSHILTAVLVLVTAFSILLIVLNMDDGNTLWFIAGLFGTLFASIGLLIRLLILFFATEPTDLYERPSFSELAFSVLVASEINVLVIVAMVSTAIAAPVVAVLVRVFTVNDVNFSAGISVSSSCALHAGQIHVFVSGAKEDAMMLSRGSPAPQQ
ncbi:hypothetical protein B0A50_00132 [Salinomyces thailandicus]|uniref:Uncharacterized protein n=1 Tax=Salinomyces thailandicus TaxID=706561 RepID=A0A4U0UGQ0_9PEZI|nr:hypothetical protein B0A50_00132 [Salinomyces thailandica]